VPEPSANRRQALIAAAYQRIASQGFEGLRTRDVAADAGVNIATLHYHFPRKEALIRGVIGHAMERFRATLPAHGSAVERLRAHLHALARLVHEDKELWAVLGELVLRAPRDSDLADTFRKTDALWHRTLRDLIEACIRSGAVASHLDANATAALMIAAIRGVSLPRFSGTDRQRVNQVFEQLELLLGLS